MRKAEKLSEAIGKIEDNLIEEAGDYHQSLKKRTRKHMVVRIVALVACFCLIISGVAAGNLMLNSHRSCPGKAGKGEPVVKETPVDDLDFFSGETLSEDALYSYEEETQMQNDLTDKITTAEVSAVEPQYPKTVYDSDQINTAQNMEYLGEFCRNTMQQLLAGGQETDNYTNKVYSPVDLYLALGMLAELTDGNTRQQILDLLEVDDLNDLQNQAIGLWESSYLEDETTTVVLGNSLWLGNEMDVDVSVLENLSEYYYASSYLIGGESVELNRIFRQWLRSQTGGLLEEKISGLELDSSNMLALVSTLYYQACWSEEFYPENTAQDIFYSYDGEIDCEFMNQSSVDVVYYGEAFSAVKKSLGTGGNMWLILPDAEISIEEMLTREAVNTDEMMTLLLSDGEWENSESVMINLSMPKFDIVSDMDMTEDLQALGVTEIFDGTVSDFTTLTTDMEGLYVSEIKHAVRVAVDEEGCTAAAYTTADTSNETSSSEREVDFVLNRPFLFVITGTDNIPLFAGVVHTPV